MLATTRNDVNWYLSQVIVTVAREIEVPDYEFFMANDLYEMIRARDKNVFQKLETFLHVYDQWWTFQEAHEAQLSGGGLSPENYQANMQLMDKRDKARKDLIDAVKVK